MYGEPLRALSSSFLCLRGRQDKKEEERKRDHC
jgi:hypothetical protein